LAKNRGNENKAGVGTATIKPVWAMKLNQHKKAPQSLLLRRENCFACKIPEKPVMKEPKHQDGRYSSEGRGRVRFKLKEKRGKVMLDTPRWWKPKLLKGTKFAVIQ